MLQKLLGELRLERVLIQADALCTRSKRFTAAHGAGAVFLLTVKANQPSLYRQISDQLLGNRKIPLRASDHGIGHGRDIAWDLRAKKAPDHIKANWHGTSWIVEVIATGTLDGKPFKATHSFVTSPPPPQMPCCGL